MFNDQITILVGEFRYIYIYIFPMKTAKTIKNHQKPSKTIKNHQKPSKTIKNLLCRSSQNTRDFISQNTPSIMEARGVDGHQSDLLSAAYLPAAQETLKLGPGAVTNLMGKCMNNCWLNMV